MKKHVYSIALVMLMSGCAGTNYNYAESDPDDPVITFGDRFGGNGIFSPARTLSVNIKGTGKCSDYQNVGAVSNHWMSIIDETIDIQVPQETKTFVSMTRNYSDSFIISSCTVKPVSFIAHKGKHYSADVELIDNMCFASIIEIMPNGEYAADAIPLTKEQCE